MTGTLGPFFVGQQAELALRSKAIRFYSLKLSPECFSDFFVGELEVVAKIVDQGRPFLRVDMVFAFNELVGHVDAKYFDFSRYSAAELNQLRTAHLMHVYDSGFHLDRALGCPRGFYYLARERCNDQRQLKLRCNDN